MNTWTDKSTIYLIESGIQSFIELDKPDVSIKLKNILTHNCILFSVFSIESCANILLHQYFEQGDLFSALEKLSIIEKINIVCMRLQGKELDLSRNEISVCKELFKIRNAYVHPKVVKTNVKISEVGPGKKKLDHDGKVSGYLKIHRRPDNWTIENARDCLFNSIIIMNHIIIDELKLAERARQDLFFLISVTAHILYILPGMDLTKLRNTLK